MAIVVATSSGNTVSWTITDNEGRSMTLTATYFVTALPQVAFSGGPIDFSGVSELTNLLQQLSVGTKFSTPGIAVSIPGVEESGGGGSYTGPLDIVSGAVVAYGQRALSSAKRGSALYTVRRDSDDTTQSFNSDATTGDAPVASITAFIGGGNGYIASWSDQGSGATDVIQNTLADQSPWAASAAGGRPGFGPFPMIQPLDEHTLETPFGTVGAGATIFMLAKAASIILTISPSDFPYVQMQTGAGANNSFIDLYDGTNEAGGKYNNSATDAFHLWEGSWEFGTAEFKIDGVTITQSQSFDSGGAIIPWGAQDIVIGTGDALTSGIAEVIYWPSLLSAPNRLAIRQNIAAYYGITLS